MATKINLRVGEVELTLECDNPLAMTDVKELISQVQELASAFTSASPVPVSHSNLPEGTTVSPLMIEHTSPKLHVSSVADRLSVKSGPDLVMAAAAYLQVVKGQQSFTRQELLDTMKAAKGHYNQNMASNLSASLKTLGGSKLNQLNNDSYAVKAHDLAELRNKLVE